MDSVFIVYCGGENEIIGAWGTYEEAEASVVRDIKRSAWYGGCELEDITEGDIERARIEYQIIEVPFAKDNDRFCTGLIIDGVPLC